MQAHDESAGNLAIVTALAHNFDAAGKGFGPVSVLVLASADNWLGGLGIVGGEAVNDNVAVHATAFNEGVDVLDLGANFGVADMKLGVFLKEGLHRFDPEVTE